MAIAVGSFHQSSIGFATGAAHLLGVTAIILMLVWLLHFREGIDYDSSNVYRVFNVHPFLMGVGFIFVAGEAMMAYKTVAALHKVQKCVHMMSHLLALILGIVGICAVFKFHDMAELEDMYSLHSWLGMGTICLFGLQWLFGFVTFFFPRAPRETRARLARFHSLFGVFIFLTAICTLEMGLAEKFLYMQLQSGTEARLINFTGLFFFLYGAAVVVSAVCLSIVRVSLV